MRLFMVGEITGWCQAWRGGEGKGGWSMRGSTNSLAWGDMVSNLNVQFSTLYNSSWLEMPWWDDRTWSTLGQVMACCLMASSHYPNQCCLVMSEVLYNSHEGNFMENAQYIYLWYEFETDQFMITATSVGVAFMSLSTKGFQLPMPSQHWIRIKDAHMYFYIS